MLTVEQAKAKILEGAEAVAEVEDMVTLYSAGKILAEDIVSEIKTSGNFYLKIFHEVFL